MITPGCCVKNLLVIKIILYQFVDSDEGSGPTHPSTAVDQDARALVVLLELHRLLDQIHQDLGAVRSGQVCPFLGLEMVDSNGSVILSVDPNSSVY